MSPYWTEHANAERRARRVCAVLAWATGLLMAALFLTGFLAMAAAL